MSEKTSKRKQSIIQAQVNDDLKDMFEELYIESGANSKGEFVSRLLDNYTNPEIIEKPVEVIKEVEKIVEKPVEVIKEVEKIVEKPVDVIKEVPIDIGENQLLITLNPHQRELLSMISKEDYTVKELNYYAASVRFREKHGDILSPLIEGEDKENMSRVLINTFFLQIIFGAGDHIAIYSNSELRKIRESIPGPDTKQEIIPGSDTTKEIIPESDITKENLPESGTTKEIISESDTIE